jgi:hypothetical protein
MNRSVSHVLRLAVTVSIATAYACGGPESFHKSLGGGGNPFDGGIGFNTGGQIGFGSGGRGTGGFIGTGGTLGTGGSTFGTGGRPATGGSGFPTGGRGSGGTASGGNSGNSGLAGASGAGGSLGTGGATPCTTCMLSVTYAPTGTADGQAISAEVHISTDRAIAINQITVKYWYTNETGSTDIVTDVDYTGLSTGQGLTKPTATGTPTVAVTPATPNANTVTSITIPEPSLLNPGTSLYIKFQIHRRDYQGTFMMANDYSFGATQLLTMPWSKITAYVGGTKAWGDEP